MPRITDLATELCDGSPKRWQSAERFPLVEGMQQSILIQLQDFFVFCHVARIIEQGEIS